MPVLDKLRPKKLFGFFEEMCQIPHGSSNMQAISDYLVRFAKERNLPVWQDDMGNVIMIKDASAGYESAPAVLLQGHMDMVCEKAPDCQKDMEKEGLDLVVEGDTIYAKGTTLGGDNGIGVATVLALLDEENISHPRLEAVFTVDEEIGMLGAVALDDLSMLQARRMINLDSEEEGIYTVSCAGGNMTKCTLPISRAPYTGQAYEITVDGLRGGHSGVEINKGRANACKLLARVLNAASKVTELRLVSCVGGLKDNAIPRAASAIVVAKDADALQKTVDRFQSEWKTEYYSTDPDVTVKIVPAKAELPCDADSTKRVIAFLSAAPNGILEMSAEIKDLPQTSLNLGVLQMKEQELSASFCLRSSLDSQKQMLVEQLDTLADAFDGKTEVFGAYSGWSYRPVSPLRDLLCEVFCEQYGYAPKIEAIHAGLECGIFAGKIPDLDCISIGPDLTEIHTCRERAHIASIGRLWKLLCETLKRMK
jgi:dipeptidase D